MRAGRLRDKVTLQEPTATQDEETGQPVDAWIDVATVWAQVEDVSGRQFFEAAAIQSEVSTPIAIRFRTEVKPKMRVLAGDRAFMIDSVQRPSNRRDRMVLMCSELSPET